MYRLLIFASFLTLRNESKIICVSNGDPRIAAWLLCVGSFSILGGGGGQRCQLQYLWRDIAKMYSHACMRTHINVHMKTMYMLLNVHTPLHACMHAHTYVCMHAHADTSKYLYILRKTIEGYLDSVPSLTSNTIKTLLIMHAFHSSRHLQSKWMLYFGHVSIV